MSNCVKEEVSFEEISIEDEIKEEENDLGVSIKQEEHENEDYVCPGEFKTEAAVEELSETQGQTRYNFLFVKDKKVEAKRHLFEHKTHAAGKGSSKNHGTGSRFQCEVCSKRLPKSYFLKSASSIRGNKNRRCEMCEKPSQDPNHLAKNPMLYCDRCEMTFKFEADLEYHQKHMHATDALLKAEKNREQLKPVQCKVEDFTSPKTLENHSKAHERVEPHKSNQWPSSFSTSSFKEAPIKDEIEEERNERGVSVKQEEHEIEDDVCPGEFKRESSVEEHSETQGQTRYNFLFKDKKVEAKKHLFEHKHHATGYRSLIKRGPKSAFHCEVCSKRLPKSYFLKSASSIRGNKNRRCEMCEKPSQDPNYLAKNPLLYCDRCEMTFKFEADLEYHQKHVHATDAPLKAEKNREQLKPVQCKVEDFTSPHTLENHSNTHERVEPHKSNQWPSSFSTSSFKEAPIKDEIEEERNERGVSVKQEEHEIEDDVCPGEFKTESSVEEHSETQGQTRYNFLFKDKKVEAKKHLFEHKHHATGYRSLIKRGPKSAFHCEMCSKRLPKSYFLKSASSIRGNKNRRCEMCEKPPQDPNHLAKNPLLYCDRCEMTFKFEADLEYHQKHMHATDAPLKAEKNREQLKPVQCKVEDFTSPHTLENHSNTHERVEPHKSNQWPSSFSTSSFKEALIKDEIEEERNERGVSVKQEEHEINDDVCPGEFKTESSVEEHSETQGQTRYNFLFKDKKVEAKKHLFEHKHHATGYRSLKKRGPKSAFHCEVCSKRLPKSYFLKSASGIQGNKNRRCEMCEKPPQDPNHLAKNPLLYCDRCEMTFKFEADLEYHQKHMHATDAPLRAEKKSEQLKPVQCKVEDFTSPHTLENHSNAHERVEPHKSNQWPSSFSTSSFKEAPIKDEIEEERNERGVSVKQEEHEIEDDVCPGEFKTESSVEEHSETQGHTRYNFLFKDKKVEAKKHLFEHKHHATGYRSLKKRGPKSPFHCEVCSKRLPKSYFLKSASGIQGNKNRRCEMCEKPSQDPNYLAKNPLLYCDRCEMTFEFEADLEYHQKHMHATDAPLKAEKNREQLKPVQCKVEGFTSPQTLEKHSEAHERVEPHKSNQWPSSFSTSSFKEAPIKDEIEEERNERGVSVKQEEHEIEDDVCPGEFKTESSVEEHSETQGQTRYNFLFKDKKVEAKKHLFEHKHHATGYRSIKKRGPKSPFHCEVCSKRLPKSYFLKSASSIQGNKNRRCEMCEKPPPDPNHLEGHDAVPTPILYCEECDILFESKASLEYHEKRMHATEDPFRCKVCWKTFALPETLENHLKSHERVRKYKCKLCRSSFLEATSLASHKFTMHSRSDEISCAICGLKFTSIFRFKIHMKRHNCDGGVKCGHCDKFLKNRKFLIAHVVSKHASEKHFQCEVCSKRFSTSQALNRHFKNHNDSKSTVQNVNRLDVVDEVKVGPVAI